MSQPYHIEDGTLVLSPTGHNQQKFIYRGNSVEIDIKLVPAIRALWNKDIKTMGCCQGTPMDLPRVPSKSNAYISFVDSGDAREFHRQMNRRCDYLFSIDGKWSLQPKVGNRLLIVLDWNPVKTEPFVKLICEVFK